MFSLLNGKVNVRVHSTLIIINHIFSMLYRMHQKTTTSSQIQEMTQYRQLKNSRRVLLHTQTAHVEPGSVWFVRHVKLC